MKNNVSILNENNHLNMDNIDGKNKVRIENLLKKEFDIDGYIMSLKEIINSNLIVDKKIMTKAENTKYTNKLKDTDYDMYIKKLNENKIYTLIFKDKSYIVIPKMIYDIIEISDNKSTQKDLMYTDYNILFNTKNNETAINIVSDYLSSLKKEDDEYYNEIINDNKQLANDLIDNNIIDKYTYTKSDYPILIKWLEDNKDKIIPKSVNEINIHDLKKIIYDVVEKYLSNKENNDKPIENNNNNQLVVWWNNLNQDWKSIFKKHINIQGNPTQNDLSKIINLTYINGEHFNLKTLEPLSQLINLKKLNVRNTAVSDLTPLKNLKKLEYLDITFTMATSFKPIWNLPNLKKILCKRSARLIPTEINDYIKSHRHCTVDWDYTEDQNWQPLQIQ